MICKIINLSGYLSTLLLVSMLAVSCEKDEAPPIIPPVDVLEVATSEAASITTTSATCGGIIISDGGTTIVRKGICWGASPAPTLADSVIEDGIDSDTFKITLTDLMVYTRYYYRAFVTNDNDTLYGEETSFTTQGGTVTDIDGNVYTTISIGSQVWMVENLRVTRYRNGDSIALVKDNSVWNNPFTLPSPGAYCYYNNNPGHRMVYGALYNFMAANRQIAPDGWHVPTKSEWSVLRHNSGFEKESGTTHWKSPNVGATNDNGFTALPGGSRSFTGTFDYIRESAYFWSSTPAGDFSGNPSGGYLIGLSYDVDYGWDGGIDQKYGFSIRCVRD